MSRVLIIGGHGKVALRLAPILAERGDEVAGVIRNPDQSDDLRSAGAEPVVADIESLDEDGFVDLVSGYDAVVWSAGAGGGNPDRTYAIDRDAAIRSMDAAAKAGAKRYVMVSYLGARADHGVEPGSSFFPYAESKAAADDHLRESPLDWTILGPGPLTLDEPTGLIEVADPGDGRVSRADVAGVAAAALHDDSTIRRTIVFGNGSVPIAEAIAG